MSNNTEHDIKLKKTKEQSELDELLTTKQVLNLLNISRTTLYELTKGGTIQGYKIGKLTRYKYSDIQKALQPIT